MNKPHLECSSKSRLKADTQNEIDLNIFSELYKLRFDFKLHTVLLIFSEMLFPNIGILFICDAFLALVEVLHTERKFFNSN